MPTAGLSLVGFMADQQQAVNHLRNACVPADPSDPALIAEWNAARAQLGAPIPNAGQPDIQQIPPAHQPHIQAMIASWANHGIVAWPGIDFVLLEIEPLLAFQFSVDLVRSAHHCGGFSHPPALGELLPICLPISPIPENFQAWPNEQSVLMKSQGLNLVSFEKGVIQASFLGMRFGPALPFLHVVRHNGRCYLHNGFHRAVGARQAGATHVPCILRDVPDHASVGIRTDGGTFDVPLLESNNPPTLGHFTQGRAYPVQIRSLSRWLHVSWSEYVIPNE